MNKSKTILFILLSIILENGIISCSSDLPDVTDAFDPGATFTQTLYEPKLGRDVLMTGNFNPGSSTLPFTMEIVNMRRYDGREAPELTEYFPVTVWKTPYLGTETSLKEIEDKRDIENRQLFQVRKHSGEFIMWAKANSSFVSCSPDSGYIFDVKVENSGGRRYYTGMRLIPERESAYEPSSIDPETGLDTTKYVHPLSMKNTFTMITSNTVYGLSQEMYPLLADDVQVYFHKDMTLDEKDPTLTFRFYKSDYTLINPDKFNLTNWKKLVHGFDMVKDTTEKFVRYKVAYPIPLTKMVTDYTNVSGESAEVTFGYSWMFNGQRSDAEITFDFAIYEEGHWDINFVFAGGDPYFGDSN